VRAWNDGTAHAPTNPQHAQGQNRPVSGSGAGERGPTTTTSFAWGPPHSPRYLASISRQRKWSEDMERCCAGRRDMSARQYVRAWDVVKGLLKAWSCTFLSCRSEKVWWRGSPCQLAQGRDVDGWVKSIWPAFAASGHLCFFSLSLPVGDVATSATVLLVHFFLAEDAEVAFVYSWECIFPKIIHLHHFPPYFCTLGQATKRGNFPLIASTSIGRSRNRTESRYTVEIHNIVLPILQITWRAIHNNAYLPPCNIPSFQ
jgi:hypothetical protein